MTNQLYLLIKSTNRHLADGNGKKANDIKSPDKLD